MSAVQSVDPSLARYLARFARVPLLDEQEEIALARRYRDHGDRSAADRLVTSHMRLVAKVALGFRGYGLPLADLVSEGGIGMLKAVEHFDPDRGIRLSTYARFWIRAQVQEYVLHSWSLVKIGTTAAEKKLFFSLRRLKAQLHEIDSGISPEGAQRIALALDLPAAAVVQMNGRLSAGDLSLTAAVDDGDTDWQENLPSGSEDQETALASSDELRQRRALLRLALGHLPPREREILSARRLSEEPVPLAALAGRYGVTPQRVRQIEAQAVEKLRVLMRRMSRPAKIAAVARAA